MKRHYLAATRLLAVLVALAGAVHCVHADENDYFDSSGFREIITYTDWTLNSYGGEPLETTSAFAGSAWSTYGFTRQKAADMPVSGYADLAVTARIASESPVSSAAGRIVVNVAAEQADLNAYAPEVRLVTGDGEADICRPVTRRSPVGRYYIFDVPESPEAREMRIELEIPKSRNGWLRLSEILFYDRGAPAAISYSPADGSCTIVSRLGELHVLAVEHDADGAPAGVASATGSPRAADGDLWLNKVADEGESYTVSAPAEAGHYLDMRIKTVAGGVHSSETRARLDARGLTTGLEGMTDAGRQPGQTVTRWYDAAGRLLDGPARGLNIRVTDGHASKVIL